jgi:23S rRNA (cytidine1920-2'-O)/16S rRNA (cytidine1409-2'-O)-methyltransferase
VVLIKPQFEAGPGASVKGIIKDKNISAQVCQKIGSLIENLGWQVLGQLPSPIAGQDGNQEFLMAAQHP